MVSRVPAAQVFFTATVFLGARPYFIALVPVCGPDVYQWCRWAYTLSAVRAPVLARGMNAAAEAALPMLMGAPEFVSLDSGARWSRAGVKVLEWGANAEVRAVRARAAAGPTPAVMCLLLLTRARARPQVMLGILMILELLTPMRNILSTFVFWQMLKIRYMASPYARAAFGNVDRRILSLTSHPRCPALIGTGYGKLRGFMESQGRVPTAEEAAARPKCVVM